jgi:hypothetical protein
MNDDYQLVISPLSREEAISELPNTGRRHHRHDAT